MILFFGDPESKVFALETNDKLDDFSIEKLNWVLNAQFLNKQTIENRFIGPKSTMISPWSTNAVEIIYNMGIQSIVRIEEFLCVKENQTFDIMIQDKYEYLNQDLFKNYKTPDKQTLIDDIDEYNNNEGLALDQNEVDYLKSVAKKLNRKLVPVESLCLKSALRSTMIYYNGIMSLYLKWIPYDIFHYLSPSRVFSPKKTSCFQTTARSRLI